MEYVMDGWTDFKAAIEKTLCFVIVLKMHYINTVNLTYQRELTCSSSFHRMAATIYPLFTYPLRVAKKLTTIPSDLK